MQKSPVLRSKANLLPPLTEYAAEGNRCSTTPKKEK